jgi:hypothetical protein
MQGNKEASWVRPQGGQSPAMGRAGDALAVSILPQEIRQLLSKLPPAGHSRQLLAFWLERHALEVRLELQHRAGAMVADHPLCPLAVSLRVDRLTMRIDAINERLLGRLSAIRHQGGGRHG